MSNYQSETDKELEEVLGSHKTIIKIVGTGGAGNNTVTRLLEVGIQGVDVIAINTDAQDLLHARSDHKILIGKNITNGLGAGSDPSRGEESARESLDDIESKLAGSDMVFITCGLGGGTGTGSAPIIANIAQKIGALTVAVVTLPFGDEGIIRWENARKGLQQLQNNVDTVIVVQNDKLLDLVPDMPLNAAFRFADEILVNAVKGMTELVTEKGLVNLDFADLRTIMQGGGLAMIGLGESETEMNAEEAAEKALENPLLDVDVTGAKSALINISGGQELSLKAAKTVMRIVAKKLDPSARIIWGARLDEAMGSSLRVMLIVTCLQTSRRSASEVEMVLNTSPEPTVTPLSLAEPTPRQSEKTAAPSEANKKRASKIFSDIFIEESDSELNLLEESIRNLSLGRPAENEKHFNEIKQACSALYSSSELFGYDRISDFVEVIEDVTEYAANGEFELSKSFLDLYRPIPSTLRSMMTDDEVAFEQAEEIKQKFGNILELVTKPDPEEADTAQKSAQSSASRPASDTQNQGIDEKQNDGDTKENVHASAGKTKSEFSSVREAVRYFDKLF